MFRVFNSLALGGGKLYVGLRDEAGLIAFHVALVLIVQVLSFGGIDGGRSCSVRLSPSAKPL
ncbi:MAG: hypothetical protein IPJ07_20750 [Acidobacteria bacterium]|nr:hypothetical protein [Acidobacteriota bacterium]